MSFRQVYYTSCEKGLSSGSGFQFNAASPEIAPSTLQRIEKLGSYAPPRSAPTRPTTAELEQFPVSLFFHTLNDSEVVLGQAKYIGIMADGRFGNFFAHSVISNDPYSDFFKGDRIIPIETWLSQSWTTSEHDSTVLPLIGNLSFGERISFASVQEFLKDPARREVLPRYLSAVVEALKTNRRIIIVDDNENVALWIAAASYALPYPLVLRLTFSTYSQNPYDTDALITGTTQDSSFHFAPHEIEHLFSVFDFKGGRFTSIVPDGFALKIAHLYQLGGELIRGFPVFIEHTASDTAVDELEDSLSTYCYFESKSVPEVNDVRVLIWSSRHLESLADKDFSRLFSTIVGKSLIGPEILFAATDFYLAALGSGINTPSIRAVCDLYIRWLITEAGSKVDPTLLNQTADQLPVHVYHGDGTEAVFKEWLKQLKSAGKPARFAPLLRLGRRIGYSEDENDILQWLGKNVAGPWITNISLQQSIKEVAGTRGGKCLLEGIAAFLVEHVDDPSLFQSFPDLVSDAECYAALSAYTVKTQNLPFYLRLSGLKANCDSADRVAALIAQLSFIQSSFNTSVAAEIVQMAIHSIWFDRGPTLNEASQLLSPPLFEYIIQSEFPAELIAGLNFNDEILTSAAIELVDKLNSEAVYSTVSENAKVTITAYVMAIDFQRSPENIGEAETILHMQWLTTNHRRLPPLAPRLFKFLGRKFVLVKDVLVHTQALPDYLKESNFLDGYQSEIHELTRTRKSHQELARLVNIWTWATKHQKATELYVREWIRLILKNLSRKDIEKLEAALDDDAFRVWMRARKGIELDQKGSLGSFLNNILGRG